MVEAKLEENPHLNHSTFAVHEASAFTCDLCQAAGFGTRHRCSTCNRDLHPFRATCPPTIHSPLHPQHELSLFRKRCNTCQRTIEGSFLKCIGSCNFHLHPTCPVPAMVCTQHHRLRLVTKYCSECEEDVTGAFYRYNACDFDAHPLCHHKTMIHHGAVEECISFFMRPAHRLKLAADSHGCEVCGEAEARAEGSYVCDPCRFYVHRSCAVVERTVVDVAHPRHILHYVIRRANPCLVCKNRCVK